MNRKKVILIAGAIIALLAVAWIQMRDHNRLNSRYEIAVTNNKAYEMQLSDQSQAFQFQVEQLRYINDSCVRQLDSVRKELRIKDNKIKQMSKVREKVYVHDTIHDTDTMFVDSFNGLDTCLVDRWRKMCIQLGYPNMVAVSTEMNLEQDCFLYSERQTIDPPRRTWIGRLFQKKHTVYNVTVVEHNPYVTVQENKFIIIDDK